MKISLVLLAALFSGSVLAKTCQEFIRPNQDYKAEMILKCKADSASVSDGTFLPTRLDQVICIQVGTYKTGVTYFAHSFYFEDIINSGVIALYNGRPKTKIEIDSDSISAKAYWKDTLGGYFPKAFSSYEAHVTNLQSEKQTYTLTHRSGTIFTRGKIGYELKATCQREL